MTVIAISTNKGGVLKTSITTNLAGALATEGQKVLIIDTDNQGNVLLSFGLNPDDQENTIYDVLLGEIRPDEAIINVHEYIDVIPANDDMSFFELDCLTNSKDYPEPFMQLKKAMAKLEKQYDYILIDSPPTLGLVQGNVLAFVDQVLIPFQPEAYSMRSLIKIIKAINGIKEKQNPKLTITGIVATLVDQRTTLHSEILQECRKFCLEHNLHMFDTVIPRSVRFASSVAYDRKPATLTDKNNPIIGAYFELLKEVKENGEKK